jgi:hypothetical protein
MTVWNVRTDKERYWVITGPTNLYSQELFRVLTIRFSFQIGLMARVQAQRKGTDDDRLAKRLAEAFRRWEQAADALEHSEEDEEVQAVGMRRRECLIAFIGSLATTSMVPDGEEQPKAADFIHWSERSQTRFPADRPARRFGYLSSPSLAQHGSSFRG